MKKYYFVYELAMLSFSAEFDTSNGLFTLLMHIPALSQVHVIHT